MGNYTPEQVAQRVNAIQDAVSAGRMTAPMVFTKMREIIAATLRQQAGRVDEGMVRKAEGLRNALHAAECKLPEGWADVAAEWTNDAQELFEDLAALAQQGDAVPVNGLVADHLISGLGKLANTVSKRMANDIREVLSAMKPLYLHAERARVPDVECPHEWYPDTDVEVDGWFRCRLCDVSRQFPKAAPSPVMEALTLEREWLASYLDDNGWHNEAANVRNGIDLESYETDLRLIDWLRRHAHLAQPAQAVDVGAVRRVIAELEGYCEASEGSCYGTLSTDLVRGYTEQLSGAIQGLGEDGWKLVPLELTPEMAAAASAAVWPVASAEDREKARAAALIVLKTTMELVPGATLDSLAAGIATMFPAYRAFIAAAPTRALSGEKAGPVGDGWQLVPVEPTLAMIEAWKVADLTYNPDAQPPSDEWQARADWRAMLAASPTPDKEGA